MLFFCIYICFCRIHISSFLCRLKAQNNLSKKYYRRKSFCIVIGMVVYKDLSYMKDLFHEIINQGYILDYILTSIIWKIIISWFYIYNSIFEMYIISSIFYWFFVWPHQECWVSNKLSSSSRLVISIGSRSSFVMSFDKQMSRMSMNWGLIGFYIHMDILFLSLIPFLILYTVYFI